MSLGVCVCVERVCSLVCQQSGSNDFHHLALAFHRRIRVPFNVVLFVRFCFLCPTPQVTDPLTHATLTPTLRRRSMQKHSNTRTLFVCRVLVVCFRFVCLFVCCSFDRLFACVRCFACLCVCVCVCCSYVVSRVMVCVPFGWLFLCS